MEQTSTIEACPAKPLINPDQQTARIRELNDLFRTGNGTESLKLGRKYLTKGIWELGFEASVAITRIVTHFNDFTDDNDPFEEHEFGSFDYQGHTIFWKIDYCATDMQHGSPDPADPSVTCRLLTVMLASEY